jgi:two-component system chemotaxis sensor kinase CheA
MDSRRGANFHVLVIGEESNAVGLAVDRILGQREIVVRAIKDPLAQTKGIAGATELGDQRVVLILDIGALRQFALKSRH